MNLEAETSDLHLDAILGSVCDAAQTREANSLYRNSGDDSQDGEQEEGREICEDKEPEDKGRTGEGHDRLSSPWSVIDGVNLSGTGHGPRDAVAIVVAMSAGVAW